MLRDLDNLKAKENLSFSHQLRLKPMDMQGWLNFGALFFHADCSFVSFECIIAGGFRCDRVVIHQENRLLSLWQSSQVKVNHIMLICSGF